MIIAQILTFAVAMLVHELGHLVAAWVCKVPVRALGLGWGPKVLSLRIRGVDFKLHALPIGAYVRLDMAELQRKPLLPQVAILLAGIVVNLGAALIAQGTWFGMMNLLLAATNLLPLYQQDGWKCGMVMLRALLERRSPMAEWTFTITGGILSVGVFAAQIGRFV